ncbi:hypothetical protein ACFLWX_00320, partial [Chloroflexota bacterium]
MGRMFRVVVTYLAILLVAVTPFLTAGCGEKEGTIQETPTSTEGVYVQCTSDSYCLTEEEGTSLGYELYLGEKIQCGVDAAGNPLYCFQKPIEVDLCPEGCVCLTKEEGTKR